MLAALSPIISSAQRGQSPRAARASQFEARLSLVEARQSESLLRGHGRQSYPIAVMHGEGLG